MINQACRANPFGNALFWIAILLVCGSVAPPALAGDVDIVITLTADSQKIQTGETHEAPSKERPKRKVVELQRGQSVQVAWLARNVGKSETLTNVLVHFFVVKENELGQQQVPKLTTDVAYEGALTMDFKPQEKATWKFDLGLPDPGSYLLRVETIGLTQKHGHEYYAALDLMVK